MLARVGRWGNSLAIRIPSRVARKLRLAEGDVVRLDVARAEPGGGRLDLSRLPTFQDRDPKASLRHDLYLYGGSDASR